MKRIRLFSIMLVFAMMIAYMPTLSFAETDADGSHSAGIYGDDSKSTSSAMKTESESNDSAKQNTVTLNSSGSTFQITATDITADSVSSAGEGYGCVTKEYNTVKGLVNSSGEFIMPYVDTYSIIKVEGDIVSMTVDSRQEIFALSDAANFIEDQNHPYFKVHFFRINGKNLQEFDTGLTMATPFSDGYAVGYKRTAFGEPRQAVVIDTNGNTIYRFPSEFNLEESFLDDWQTNAVNGDSLIMGAYICQKGSKWLYWYSDGLIPCYDVKWTRNDYPIDDGKTEADYWYDNLYDCENVGLAYYDRSGNKVIDWMNYIDSGIFKEGLSDVKNPNGKWGYIDKNGNEVIACEYDSAGVFNDGLAKVSKNGKTGYINSRGETVIPLEYDGAYGAGDGLASVVRDGKCGLVDYNNNVVVPLEYDDISSMVKGTAYAIKNGKLYIIHKTGDGGHEHSLTHVAAKAATCTAAGNKEYWKCSCGKNFSDENGNVEINLSATVIPATGHSYGAWQTTLPATEEAEGISTRICSKCGATENQVLAQLAPTLTVVSKVKKPKAAKGAITVNWKKASKKNQKKIGGYQIQVATDANFTNIVKRVNAGKKSSSKKIKGLAKKTAYYVRVRTYKGAQRGAWSAVKSAKTK